MADKLKVVINDEQKDIKVQTGIRMLLRRCCHAVLENEDYKGSAKIGITFTDNKRLENRCLSKFGVKPKHEFFSQASEGKQQYSEKVEEFSNLGDIFISFEKAMEIADKHNNTIREHLALITAYGVLELLGYGQDRVGINERVDLAMYQLGLPSSSIYNIMDT